MITTAIFDMDGLLVDTEPLWQEAEIKVFQSFGQELTREQCMETTGLRIEEVIAFRYRKQSWEGPSQLEVRNSILEELEGLFRQKAVLLPGAENLLEWLTAKNMLIGLASSSPRRTIDFLIEQFSLKNYFKVVRSAETEQYGKPHPAVYLKCAEELQSDPDACIAFEDSFNGMIAALAARLTTIVVPSPHERGQARFNSAHLILNSLEYFNEDSLNHLNISLKA